MSLLNNLAKILSALHLVVLVVGYTVSGWMEDPIQFYQSFYGETIVPPGVLPEPSRTALEHMSMTLTQLLLMFGLLIFLAAWEWHAPRFSMVLGLLNCISILGAERVVPTPLTNIWKFGGITFPYVDLTPLVFGILFLLGVLFVRPDSTTSKPIPLSVGCKSWAVIYGNLVVLSMYHVLMNPTHFYTFALGRSAFFDAEAGVQMLLRRQAFLMATMQVLHAAVLFTQVFFLKPGTMLKPLLYFPMVFHLLQILYIQLYCPWQPHARLFVPTFKGDVILMPPFVTQVLILVGSLGCLHQQQALEEEARVTALMKKKE